MVIIMKYDLIALDMDGTLLNDDKVIPKENVDAIMEKLLLFVPADLQVVHCHL